MNFIVLRFIESMLTLNQKPLTSVGNQSSLSAIKNLSMSKNKLVPSANKTTLQNFLKHHRYVKYRWKKINDPRLEP